MYVTHSDSRQVGSLASQRIWPQFRRERLLGSRATEASIFPFLSFSVTHTCNCRKKHSPWGLTERAASDLLKLDDTRVATQACENTMWHLGTQTVNHLLMYGVQCVTFAMCSFIQSAVLSVRPQRETKIACTFSEGEMLTVRHL